MSDRDAMEAIAETLERYYRGNLSAYDAINRISQIKGAHRTEEQQ